LQEASDAEVSSCQNLEAVFNYAGLRFSPLSANHGKTVGSFHLIFVYMRAVFRVASGSKDVTESESNSDGHPTIFGDIRSPMDFLSNCVGFGFFKMRKKLRFSRPLTHNAERSGL
jgi:hypothetical protein